MMVAAEIDLKPMRSFLIALRALRCGKALPTFESLSNFLGQLARLRKLASEAAVGEKPDPQLDPARFAEFVSKFGPVHETARRDGAFVDVWAIAGIQSNEIRNASVLAWLLDARQTHGRGNTFLAAWLRRLDPWGLVPFLSSSAWSGGYSVVTESYPVGDMENRVDVVLESARALLFIEVKINARENEHQVERYLALANAKARTRVDPVDAGLIYLTPSWAAPPAIQAPKQVVHAKWIDVAHAIDEVAAASTGFVDRLLIQFAQHVRTF
jgi:hypothetical protein